MQNLSHSRQNQAVPTAAITGLAARSFALPLLLRLEAASGARGELSSFTCKADIGGREIRRAVGRRCVSGRLDEGLTPAVRDFLFDWRVSVN